MTDVKFSRIERVLTLVVDVEERGLEPAACVVDQHVDSTCQRTHRVGNEGVDLLTVADVEHAGDDRSTDLVDGARNTREPVGVAVAQRERRSEPCERDRYCLADSLRGAGDDRDLVGEQRVVGCRARREPT